MDDLNQLIKKLNGDSDPVFFDCIVAVTSCSELYLIESDSPLGDMVFDGCDLEDNLTDMKNAPNIPGVYRCKVRYHVYRSHHPLDPVEYDANLTIESYKKIQIRKLIK